MTTLSSTIIRECSVGRRASGFVQVGFSPAIRLINHAAFIGTDPHALTSRPPTPSRQCAVDVLGTVGRPCAYRLGASERGSSPKIENSILDLS